MSQPERPWPVLGPTWRRAMALAAATLWGAALLPVLTGQLRECGHCLGTYLACLPIVPGVLLPVLLRAADAWFAIAGALATAGLGAVVLLGVRELPRRLGQGLLVVAGAVVAAQGFALAAALRA